MTKKTAQDKNQIGFPFINIKLTRPIVFLDIESTGLNIGTDRIVELALLKVSDSGEKIIKTYRVNPEIPIPAEVTKIHGISDSDVADAPTFKIIAGEVASIIRGCDLGGYNSDKFDIPMLAEEFARVGYDIDLKENKFVDVQAIFFLKEPRNLAAAYKFYCNKDLMNAHSALADVEATWEILQSQLERYTDLGRTVDALSAIGQGNKFADFAGRIVYNEVGEEVLNFGKYKGQKVLDVFAREKSYYNWMMDGDFPAYTKKIITRLYLKLRESR
ncbi:MAG: 3'-5' exonuclease [Porphyromonadaceae bacterium]|nr:MAG: 3'-5' exonuclease [Porphyromonadaceae bacterium]